MSHHVLSESSLTIKYTQFFFHATSRHANKCETFDTYPMALKRLHQDTRLPLGTRCELFVEGHKGIAMV